MPIDTLKAAKRLQEGDTFSPEQAERIAEILSDLDASVRRRTIWTPQSNDWTTESTNWKVVWKPERMNWKVA